MERYDVSKMGAADAIELENVLGGDGELRTYRVACPGAHEYPYLQRIFRLQAMRGAGGAPTAEEAELIALYCRDDDGNEVDFDAKLLGDALVQMKRDRVPLFSVEFVAQIAFARFASGEALAKAMVAAEGEAVARANRAARRASAKAPAKKQPASKRKAGSSSSRASGARQASRVSRTSTPASSTSAPRAAAKKTA